MYIGPQINWIALFWYMLCLPDHNSPILISTVVPPPSRSLCRGPSRLGKSNTAKRCTWLPCTCACTTAAAPSSDWSLKEARGTCWNLLVFWLAGTDCSMSPEAYGKFLGSDLWPGPGAWRYENFMGGGFFCMECITTGNCLDDLGRIYHPAVPTTDRQFRSPSKGKTNGNVFSNRRTLYAVDKYQNMRIMHALCCIERDTNESRPVASSLANLSQTQFSCCVAVTYLVIFLICDGIF